MTNNTCIWCTNVETNAYSSDAFRIDVVSYLLDVKYLQKVNKFSLAQPPLLNRVRITCLISIMEYILAGVRSHCQRRLIALRTLMCCPSLPRRNNKHSYSIIPGPCFHSGWARVGSVIWHPPTQCLDSTDSSPRPRTSMYSVGRRGTEYSNIGCFSPVTKAKLNPALLYLVGRVKDPTYKGPRHYSRRSVLVLDQSIIANGG